MIQTSWPAYMCRCFSCSKQYSSVITYLCDCKPYYQPLHIERNVTGKHVVQKWNISFCSCTDGLWCTCKHTVFSTYNVILLHLSLSSITTNTHFANNFTRWRLVSTLDSDHHQAMIQDFEHVQKQKTISWRSPPCTLKIR